MQRDKVDRYPALTEGLCGPVEIVRESDELITVLLCDDHKRRRIKPHRICEPTGEMVVVTGSVLVLDCDPPSISGHREDVETATNPRDRDFGRDKFEVVKADVAQVVEIVSQPRRQIVVFSWPCCAYINMLRSNDFHGGTLGHGCCCRQRSCSVIDTGLGPCLQDGWDGEE